MKKKKLYGIKADNKMQIANTILLRFHNTRLESVISTGIIQRYYIIIKVGKKYKKLTLEIKINMKVDMQKCVLKLIFQRITSFYHQMNRYNLNPITLYFLSNLIQNYL